MMCCYLNVQFEGRRVKLWPDLNTSKERCVFRPPNSGTSKIQFMRELPPRPPLPLPLTPLMVCSFRPVSVHPEFAQSLLGLSNSKEGCGLSNDIWAEQRLYQSRDFGLSSLRLWTRFTTDIDPVRGKVRRNVTEHNGVSRLGRSRCDSCLWWLVVT